MRNRLTMSDWAINIKMQCLFYCILHFAFTNCFGQSSLEQRVEKVENNLMTQKAFLDSSLARFSIYDRMKFYKIPSVSIAVINEGKVDWAKAYGMADIEMSRSATISTRYQA